MRQTRQDEEANLFALGIAHAAFGLAWNRFSKRLRRGGKDISEEFLRGFEGMTDAPVSRDELIAAREALITEIVGKMPDAHRKFLISFEEGKPDWSLLGLANVQDFAGGALATAES